MITLEQIDTVLDYPTIEIVNKESTFKRKGRNRFFVVNDRTYRIEWYVNQGFLYYNDLTIFFNYLKRDNFYPHRSKMDLRFLDNINETVAILQIDWYD